MILSIQPFCDEKFGSIIPIHLIEEAIRILSSHTSEQNSFDNGAHFLNDKISSKMDGKAGGAKIDGQEDGTKLYYSFLIAPPNEWKSPHTNQ